MLETMSCRLEVKRLLEETISSSKFAKLAKHKHFLDGEEACCRQALMVKQFGSVAACRPWKRAAAATRSNKTMVK